MCNRSLASDSILDRKQSSLWGGMDRMTQNLGCSAVVVVVCDLLKISYFISTSSFFSLRYFRLGLCYEIFVLSIEWKDTDRRKEPYRWYHLSHCLSSPWRHRLGSHNLGWLFADSVRCSQSQTAAGRGMQSLLNKTLGSLCYPNITSPLP